MTASLGVAALGTRRGVSVAQPNEDRNSDEQRNYKCAGHVGVYAKTYTEGDAYPRWADRQTFPMDRKIVVPA